MYTKNDSFKKLTYALALKRTRKQKSLIFVNVISIFGQFDSSL